MISLLAVTTLCVASASARSATPVFDPSTLKGPAKGNPNDIMILGTAHLAQLPPTFQPASLDVLKERLIAWKPRVVAIEGLSGAQCDMMRRYPQRNAATIQKFCTWDPAPARAATGLDVPGATAEMDRLLANWPAEPAPSQRRRLAAVFLAGGEPVSALVQWLRLPEAERRVGDGIDATLANVLDNRRFGRGPRGEDTLIAAPLAASVGLERVVSMDDHTISDVPTPSQDGYEEAVAAAWNNPANTERARMYRRLFADVDNADKVMSLYRAFNDPSHAKVIYTADFGAVINEASPQQFGRTYVANWETRNLRMASNIREAVRNHPGNRTLVIVGFSHKWYLEAYLNQMHDVRIVSTDEVLR
ncbi:MAG: DUF5694 domain-containing protein [Janthinobacterium lividum]